MSDNIVAVATADNLHRAGLFRRLAAIAYDSLLIAAIWMLVGSIHLYAFGIVQAATSLKNNILFALVLAVYFGFFCWFWMKNGQTLGMRAWRIKLQNIHPGELTLRQCLIRLCAAVPSLAFFGLGYLWLYIDKNHDCLHDRLSKSKIVVIPKKPN